MMTEQGPLPDLELTMFSQPRLLTAVRAMICHLARRLGFTESHASQVSLAVDEALCNVINHGYQRRPDGRITLRVWALDGDPEIMKVTIEDRAVQVDPTTIQSRDLNDIRPGGLGVHIMREIMDEVIYQKRQGGGMVLTMIKSNPGDTPPPNPGDDSRNPRREKLANDG